ncbi:MAG: fibronectin type III domain-containing protein [Flavonifractor plautii]
MQKRNKVLAGVLTGALVLSAGPMALAATANYNDSSVTGGSAAWQDWVKEWETVATDYTKVSLTPGADETQLNFAWYSKTESGKAATPVVHFGTDKDHLTAFTGKAAQVDNSLTDGVAYDYNHVTVTGLEANTTYYYTVEKNGVQSEVQEYKTGSFDSVKMLYVGDPQIGASKGQPQSGEVLAASSGAANTAARNDAFAWNRTLEIATAQNPGVNFIISAGDQVNKTGQAKEEEYAGYLSPAVLAGLPVATTIGNHDSLNPDYTYHFNNPNATENGKTQAGGDYYYSYGAGLFIVLNTNNYNVAEHEKTIQEAIASAPDAAWRVVTIHQDIYGTGLDHSDTDGMILRTQLTPIFDKYDIDVVLQGHDHTYSRSKLLYGDGQTHGTYEFRLNADGSDYDWDNAFNTQTDEKIPLYPEEGDTAGTALHNAFQADNGCYTIEDTTGNTVVIRAPFT